MRIIIPHIIMIAMILGFHPNALGGPVPDPEGDIVVQVQQQVGSQEQCLGQGCLGEKEPEPETEPEQEPEPAVAATTTPALTQVRLLVKPIKGKTPLMNYTESVQYCKDMPGGEPFIPKTSEDRQMYMNDSFSLLGVEDFMWLPLNDLSTEGQLQWSNGDDAMTDAQEIPWLEDIFMNTQEAPGENIDCVIIVGPAGGLVTMNNCAGPDTNGDGESEKIYPMICEIKMNVSDEEQMLLEKISSLGSIEIIEDTN